MLSNGVDNLFASFLSTICGSLLSVCVTALAAFAVTLIFRTSTCFQYFVIFKSFFQSLVSFFCCQTFVSQQNLSFTIVYFQDFCFHFVVNMNNILEIYA